METDWYKISRNKCNSNNEASAECLAMQCTLVNCGVVRNVTAQYLAQLPKSRELALCVSAQNVADHNHFPLE